MTVVINRRRIFTMLEAPFGTTGRYTFAKGERVANNARNLLSGKVRTGRLRSNTRAQAPQRIAGRRRGITVRVGTFNVEHAKWVMEGTGIYGPHGSPIVPVRAQFLRFPLRDGKIVYARSVRGVPPYPYLSMALSMEMGRGRRGRRA